MEYREHLPVPHSTQEELVRNFAAEKATKNKA
jgi:hypothetical protein